MKAHGQQVPQPTLIKSLCTYMESGGIKLSLLFQQQFYHKMEARDNIYCVSSVFMMLQQIVSNVPELEPSYPGCAYLVREQPANVLFPKTK